VAPTPRANLERLDNGRFCARFRGPGEEAQGKVPGTKGSGH